MSRIAYLAVGSSLWALALVAGATPAQAQESQTVPTGPATPPPEADHVERVTGLPPGVRPAGVGREGVRIVKPGALLFASYDANHDGKITQAEIEAGALASFAIADKNNDGALSGFEQADWAQLVGGANDVLSNPMQFDTNLDRLVTKAEFTSGILRLAKTLMKPGQTELTYADLIQALPQPGGQQAESGEAPPLQKPGGKGKQGRN